MKVEVKGNQSQEVDWTKNPQLVVGEITISIILVHENQSDRANDSSFVGTKLNGTELSEYSNEWSKEFFKPFHGEITLKND